jgi:hypothetical protein
VGIFAKRQRAVVPPQVIGLLGAFGQASITARAAGRPVDDPRFGWEYMSDTMLALGGEQRNEVIQELYIAASTASDSDRDLVTFGVYRLLAEYDGQLDDQRFWELCDASLNYMHSRGFSSGHLTGYEAQRWIAVHGELRSSFDGIVDVAVPNPDSAPSVDELVPGANKLVALTAPLPEGNAFYAERQQDGTYAIFSERQKSSEDPTRARYDETYLGSFDGLPDVLRALGQMFGTRPYWADPDLDPYFPSRRA